VCMSCACRVHVVCMSSARPPIVRLLPVHIHTHTHTNTHTHIYIFTYIYLHIYIYIYRERERERERERMKESDPNERLHPVHAYMNVCVSVCQCVWRRYAHTRHSTRTHKTQHAHTRRTARALLRLRFSRWMRYV